MHHNGGTELRRLYQSCWSSVTRSFIPHVPLYLCTLSFGVVTATLVVMYGLPFPLGSAAFFLLLVGKLALLMTAAVAMKHLWHLYRAGGHESPLIAMLRRLLDSVTTGDRIGNIVHGILTFTPLMMMFAALKADLTRIRPFSWDAIFMNLGTKMGLGRPFWEILQPALGHPPITAFLSFVYGMWFPVMFVCLFCQLTRPINDITRSQYLLSYAFAWFFGGFVLAAVFSSAGPCFYDHVVGGHNPYAPLLHYLRETDKHWPIWTVDAQDALWQSYLTGKGDIQGISAMPSMHVTIATLMTLLAWRTNRWLGIAFTVFTGTVVLSSIMLGWHYSADGLAGIVLGYLFWTLAGQVSRGWARDQARFAEKPLLAGHAA